MVVAAVAHTKLSKEQRQEERDKAREARKQAQKEARKLRRKQIKDEEKTVKEKSRDMKHINKCLGWKPFEVCEKTL